MARNIEVKLEDVQAENAIEYKGFVLIVSEHSVQTVNTERIDEETGQTVYDIEMKPAIWQVLNTLIVHPTQVDLAKELIDRKERENKSKE